MLDFPKLRSSTYSRKGNQEKRDLWACVREERLKKPCNHRNDAIENWDPEKKVMCQAFSSRRMGRKIFTLLRCSCNVKYPSEHTILDHNARESLWNPPTEGQAKKHVCAGVILHEIELFRANACSLRI